MQVNIVKLSPWRIPRQFLDQWLIDVAKQIKKNTGESIQAMEITIAFVDSKGISKLNQDFRSKSKVTDILSFSGIEESSLGELAICGEVVDRQAADNNHSRNEELGYLLIHGVLHLLGYEHEQCGAAEKQMFEIQDKVFDVLRKRYF